MSQISRRLLVFAIFFTVLIAGPAFLGSAGSNNDVGKLLEVLPSHIVHGYFWLTLPLYIVGIFFVFRFSKTARFMQTHKGEMNGSL